MYKPSVLVLLIQTYSPQSSVGIVEHLKETLVDHVFRYVHTKQRYHVLDKMRDVLQVADEVFSLFFVEKL